MKKTKEEIIKLLKECGDLSLLSFKMIHTTYDEKTVEKIKENGFNLKNFGKTGKLFNPPENLIKYDPKGVFAMELDKYNIEEERPNVLFELNNVYTLKNTEIAPTDLKALIWNKLEAESASELSKVLKLAGVDVIKSKAEAIIINIDKIEIYTPKIKSKIERSRRNRP